MPNLIPDLWGDIEVNVVTPVAVLRVQAARLTERTRRLLEGRVVTTISNADATHGFHIVAPSLGNYQYELFTVSHSADLVYPVQVHFAPWQASDSLQLRSVTESAESRVADDVNAFISMVGEILGSGKTKAAISSLLARINDTEQTQKSA